MRECTCQLSQGVKAMPKQPINNLVRDLHVAGTIICWPVEDDIDARSCVHLHSDIIILLAWNAPRMLSIGPIKMMQAMNGSSLSWHNTIYPDHQVIGRQGEVSSVPDDLCQIPPCQGPADVTLYV